MSPDQRHDVLGLLKQQFPELLALYLFGSEASGEAGPRSDVDLAVLLPGKAPPLLLWEAANAVGERLGRDVDLVDLRAASTVMQYQVITTGDRLWALDARAALYESFILSEKTALDAARALLLDDILRTGKVLAHG
jgi:predicted nucleotidyltransferase